MQCPNQSESNWILLEVLCQKNGAVQVQYIQHAAVSIGIWILWEKESLYYSGEALFATSLRWTPVLEKGATTILFFHSVWKVSANGKFWQL